jgi:BolA protein
MQTLEQYRERIAVHFEPSHLELIDNSASHSGHFASESPGPSHLTLRIQAESLKNLSKVQQHQKIYALFADELQSGAIHAFSIEVLPS